MKQTTEQQNRVRGHVNVSVRFLQDCVLNAVEGDKEMCLLGGTLLIAMKMACPNSRLSIPRGKSAYRLITEVFHCSYAVAQRALDAAEFLGYIEVSEDCLYARQTLYRDSRYYIDDISIETKQHGRYHYRGEAIVRIETTDSKAISLSRVKKRLYELLTMYVIGHRTARKERDKNNSTTEQSDLHMFQKRICGCVRYAEIPLAYFHRVLGLSLGQCQKILSRLVKSGEVLKDDCTTKTLGFGSPQVECEDRTYFYKGFDIQSTSCAYRLPYKSYKKVRHLIVDHALRVQMKQAEYSGSSVRLHEVIAITRKRERFAQIMAKAKQRTTEQYWFARNLRQRKRNKRLRLRAKEERRHALNPIIREVKFDLDTLMMLCDRKVKFRKVVRQLRLTSFEQMINH